MGLESVSASEDVIGDLLDPEAKNRTVRVFVTTRKHTSPKPPTNPHIHFTHVKAWRLKEG